jgi:hypothetical protein
MQKAPRPVLRPDARLSAVENIVGGRNYVRGPVIYGPQPGKRTDKCHGEGPVSFGYESPLLYTPLDKLAIGIAGYRVANSDHGCRDHNSAIPVIPRGEMA